MSQTEPIEPTTSPAPGSKDAVTEPWASTDKDAKHPARDFSQRAFDAVRRATEQHDSNA